MFLEQLKNETNKIHTAKGARVFEFTKSSLLDYFSLGGSLREKHLDSVELFSRAFAEDNLAAVRLAFYFRDIRGGQGQRQAFREQMNYLASLYPDSVASKILSHIPEYGRWDDLVKMVNHENKIVSNAVLEIIKQQLSLDKDNMSKGESISLLAKWMPSENTSSKETVALAKKIRLLIGMSSKEYRKTLSSLRAYLDVVERKMASKEWQTIKYESVPSKAMLLYRKAFDKQDNERFTAYKEALSKGEAKINAGAIYPHEIVDKVLHKNENDPSIIGPMWNSLPDYIEGKDARGIVVADVSCSMSGTPMAVSIALALYISERTKGTFKNHFITFSEKPTLQQVRGNNIVEKVINLSHADWGGTTNLESTFRLILGTAKKNNTPQSEMPERLYIVSDMQFDAAMGQGRWESGADLSFIQQMKKDYNEAGYELPFLVFWNVNATNQNVPMTIDERGFLNVSGSSPSIFKHLLSENIIGPMDLVYEVVNSERYKRINF